MTNPPESLPDDITTLKRIIAEMARDAVAAQAEIAKLKFQLARYRRAEFGRSSEKLAREAEQLELAIESLETDQAERLAAASPAVAAAIEEAVERHKPARRPLPAHLLREEILHPAACACPHCGGVLRRIGEDVTETLDYVPGRFKVIRHVREKLSCRACDTVIAAPVPDHAIARGRAGAGLLAHLVVSKYDDHLPLYRQAEIFAREGVNLETSTLSGWVGATAAALKPLVDALAAEVMGSDTLHVDDTPVPVLAPGTGKTKTGRLWTYVRDERPFAGSRPPAALFFYSPDRKGEHPRVHLKDFRGVIHADGYSGFKELFAGNRITEAACWAHVRRKFFDVHATNGSLIAKEALDRIGNLYGVEKMIAGAPPDHRRAERQQRSKPIAEALRVWAEVTLPKLSRKSELAKAFRYMRARWKALLRCLDDGRLALDNNPAERALRCVAIAGATRKGATPIMSNRTARDDTAGAGRPQATAIIHPGSAGSAIVQQGEDRRILFLFRHGETDWNRAGRLQGHTDTSLNPTGLAQAGALAQRLLPHRLDAVLSSDLSRALTTGRIIAEALGLPLSSDPGLRETNVGAAEGLLWTEAKARFGAELTERWYDGDTAFPGGETGSATLTRGLAALRRFAAANPYRRIGVSSHGAMLRQLVRHALPPGSPPVRVANTALFILNYEPAAGRLAIIAEEELG
ncbi:MAG TPA: IS66 family transposase [Stellaceae bacterium]